MAKKKSDREAFAEAVKSAVTIEPMALEEEFVRLPADIASFNEQFAEALEEFLRAKRNEERTYARLYMSEREGAEKKTTEAMVRHTVELHPDYEAATLRRIMAEVEKARLRGVLDALSAKRDSLISVGAQIRDERRHGPTILD